MNATEFVTKSIEDRVRAQIEALGIAGYALDIQLPDLSPPAAVYFLKPRIEIAIPTPHTVAELLTYAGALHPGRITEEGKRIGGRGFYLAPAHTDKPIGFVNDDIAVDILTNMDRLKEAIKDIGSGRSMDDPFWNDKKITEVITVGESFRIYREEWNATPLIKNKGGRPPISKKGIDYDRGFELLTLKFCKSDQEAFLKVIDEMPADLPEKEYLSADPDLYEEELAKFKSAMTYRRRKHKFF